MDLHATPPRPSIWQKHGGKNSERPRCWFSRSTNIYHKTSNIHNRNCVGKPPTLLRLSSTGDSVEDTADFRSFEPSNLRGSESNSRDRGKPKPGFFDCLKLAFSPDSTDFRQKAAMSFTRESSERLPGQVDLSILVEKFDRPKDKMATVGQFAYENVPLVGVHAQQGGLNGFVKEGIYHPFTRNSPCQVATTRQSHQVAAETQQQRPLVHAFPLLNIGPFHPPNHRHQHPHPYTRRNHFMPDWRSAGTVSSQQFQHHTPQGAPPFTSDRMPYSHRFVGAQIRDSEVLRNWPVDPRIRAQFINAESIAARVQGHVKEPKEIIQSHRMSRPCRHGQNHMMKNRTGMTQQNPNKSTECGAHTGSPHQAHRQPRCAINTVAKQNNGCPQKSAKHLQPVSKCRIQQTNQDGKALDQCPRASENHNVPEHEQKVEAQEMKGLKIQEEIVSKTTDFGTAIESQVDRNQSMHQHSCVASSVHSPNLETDPHKTAEVGSQSSIWPKSGDNETTTGTRPIPGDDGKCHLSASQIRLNLVGAEPVQNVFCIKETCRLTLDDGVPSDATQSQHPENAASRLSLSNAAVISPREQSQANDHPPSIQAQSSDADSGPSPDPKPLHSSLAFLLSETPNSDSDFTDSDWDSTGTSPSSDSWDFLKCCDDPYNPLYGWKCSGRLKQCDAEQDADSKLDSSCGDDERDSGISSLRAQKDDTADVSPDDSDSWDEDEFGEEDSSNLCQLWKSFCSYNDRFNPLNGWMCSTQASENHSCTSTTENATDSAKRPIDSEVQFKFQEQDRPEKFSSLPVTGKLNPSRCETVKSGKIPAPQKNIDVPAKLHPSVLFILSVDDSDSESDHEDQGDFDDCTADGDDNAWNSFQFQVCSDPYNPLQGWKVQVTTPEKLQAVNASYDRLASLNENSTTELSDSSQTPDQLLESVTAPKTIVKPPLKRGSSTGCLLVPVDDGGSCRPFLNKKVHFCEDSPTIIDFEVPSWSSEYSDSRRGPWQEMARDRCRFRDRICSIEARIAHVFTPDHRHEIQQRLQTEV